MAGVVNQSRCAVVSELTTIRTRFYYNSGPRKGDEILATCHRAVSARLALAFRRASRYSQFGRNDEVERVDSFNCREIRAGGSLSHHAFGLAWDIFATLPTVPPPGGVWTPYDTFGAPFASCFTDLGFTWGRNFSTQDDPHVEWSSSYVPPLTVKERTRTRRLAKTRWKK